MLSPAKYDRYKRRPSGEIADATSSLDTTSRTLFELRFERSGFAAALARRLDHYRKQPSETLPERLWTVTSGKGIPAFVALHRWTSLGAREASLGRYLASNSAPRHGRIGDPTACLSEVESWLIIDSPSGGLFTAPMLHLMSVHEMRIQQCVNGSVRDAADAVAQGELALLAARGAGVLGLYELAIGPSRPVIVSILAWPSEELRQASWREQDCDPTTEQWHLEGRARLRRRLLGAVEHYRLRPVDLGNASGLK